MPAKKKRVVDNPLKWSREDKLKLLRQYEAEDAAERATDLESKGWRVWYAAIFGDEFITNLAPHHIEAIEWHWNATVARRAGLSIDQSTYPAVWPRGHRKSDIIRHIVVADACLMPNSYCLYVSGTKSKVRGHAISVETLIASPGVAAYYPLLAKVKRNLQGSQKSWSADLLYSDSGSVFHFVGLSEGVAGANIDNVRPSLIVGDDIDDREDSPMISESRLKVFTRSVLPTRQRNTLVFIAQNYISRHGVIYRIHTGKERVLTNRVATEPIPAVRNMVTEPRTIDGIVHDIIIEGQPTWEHYDLKRAQEEIDTIGLNAFIAECQHDVEHDKAGVVLTDYSEDVHVIGWGAFNAMYRLPENNRDVPAHWRKFCGYDHGSSEGHETAVSWLGVAAQNGPLPGTIFFYKLMTAQTGEITGVMAHRILAYILAPLLAEPATYMDLGLLDRATADMGDAMASDVRRRITQFLAKRQDFAMFHASHEQKALRDVLRMIYALPFQACVDEGDVLTENGWTPIQEVEIGDYVYSSDLKGELSLKRVEAVQHNWYKGDLVKVRSKGLYQSFTPDHQILFRNDNKGTSKEKWRLQPWNEIGAKTVDVIRAPLSYQGDGDWEPPVTCIGKREWLAFLGLWLAEGCVDKNGNGIRITQCAYNKQPQVAAFLSKLPWKFKLYGNGDFVTSNAELHHYLEQFGKAHQKFIPSEILRHATSEELFCLFQWMMFGDGASDGNCYYSTSQQLADGFSEVALKLGWKVYMREQPCHCVPVNMAHRMQWVVNLSRSQFPSTKVAKVGAAARLNSFTEPYEGMVYDLTVEDNHTFVIRQQGRVWISGNCNPKSAGGVEQWKQYLRPDMDEEHPFKPGKNGLCKFYMVVDDGQIDKPVDDAGLAMARFELPEWRWRQQIITVSGLLDERPAKQYDNVANSIQMILSHFSLTATPLTTAERVEAAIPQHLRYDELLKNSPFEKGLTPEQEMAHLFAVAHARKHAGKGRIQRFRDGERIG